MIRGLAGCIEYFRMPLKSAKLPRLGIFGFPLTHRIKILQTKEYEYQTLHIRHHTLHMYCFCFVFTTLK